MLLCIRTTLDIDDSLLQEVKVLARSTGKTLKAVVEDALRERLARRKVTLPRSRVTLHTFCGEGLHPGVDLDDSRALLDIMDGIPRR